MTYVSENFWHDAVNKATTDLFTFGYKHICLLYTSDAADE